MTTIGSRLARLERAPALRAPTPEETSAFWEKHLDLLSNEQLDRLEELYIHYAGANYREDNRSLEDVFADISNEHLIELRAFWATMGLDENEWGGGSMTNFATRLSRVEKARPVVATFKGAGEARKKLAALVDQHGGQLPGESPAQATARVLGISTRQLLAELQEKADA